MSLDVQFLHHVSLTVRDVERSRRFYREVIGLAEIARPPFNFGGAWFALSASQQLHLIESADGTFRSSTNIDTKDVHFAVRVSSYRAAVEYLRAQGLRDDQMRLNPRATAGFPQIYILDPDNHVIEINAAVLD